MTQQSDFESTHEKHVFTDSPVHLVKCKSTKEYDYFTIGKITEVPSMNFLEATLKLPKGAMGISFKITYFLPKEKQNK